MDRTAILAAEVEALRGDNEALTQAVADANNRAAIAERKLAADRDRVKPWAQPGSATLRDHLTRAKSAADAALAKAKADQADEGTRIKLKMTAHTIGQLLEGM